MSRIGKPALSPEFGLAANKAGNQKEITLSLEGEGGVRGSGVEKLPHLSSPKGRGTSH